MSNGYEIVSGNNLDHSKIFRISDDELLELWNGSFDTLQGEDTYYVLDEIVGRSTLSFSRDLMSEEAVSVVRSHLMQHSKRGVYLTPPHGQLIFDNAKSAILKRSTHGGLLGFHILVSGEFAYGFVRFKEAELISFDEAETRFEEHHVTRQEMEKWWKGKTTLYIYSIRDFIPFNAPVPVVPVEGSNVFVEEVIFTEPQASTISKSCRNEVLFKNEEQRLVYGPVLVPNTPDFHGDVVSEVEIIKAAHRFMLSCQMLGVEHAFDSDEILPVESFIAPQDLVFGDTVITKGTWMLGAKVFSDEIWNRVKTRSLRGFSIEGLADVYRREQ